jgi:CBS domain-containing protein
MLVGDVMTVPAVTIGADAGSGTIWAAFSHTRGRRMPVVDAQGRLQGVLARKDFLEALPLKMR